MRRALTILLLVGGCDPAAPGPTKDQAAADTADGKADWSLDYCETQGWYDDGECDWFCPSADPDCDVGPLGPEPGGAPLEHPVLLAHGFDASPDNHWAFFEVKEALELDGHMVFVAEVPPYNSVETRAQFLATEVDHTLAMSGADKVNIIAHSMGGLDARRLASPAGLGYGDRISSIVMLGTANRGTKIADVALGLIPGFAADTLGSLASFWGGTFSDRADDSDIVAALTSLSESRARDFDIEMEDDDRVYYQSWAGVSSVLGRPSDETFAACGGKLLIHAGTADVTSPLLLPPAIIMAAYGGVHDGMITVESTKHGEFMGCVPADHLDLVGQVANKGPDSNTGFDHIRFYRNLAFDLAARGH